MKDKRYLIISLALAVVGSLFLLSQADVSETVQAENVATTVGTTSTAVPSTTEAPTTTTYEVETTTTTAPPAAPAPTTPPSTRPVVVPTTRATPPPTRAATTAPAPQQSSPGGFLACVRNRESKGNYHVVNSSSGAGGAYQYLPSTWQAMGYAQKYGVARAEQATPAQQDAAAQDTLNRVGTSPWAGPGC